MQLPSHLPLVTGPPFYVKMAGEQTTDIELGLTRARQKAIVRFTGGCGNMEPKFGEGMIELLAESFNGFSGAMLFGGTRMLRISNPHIIIPGITEAPPMIWRQNHGSTILGVVAKTEILHISNYGVVVNEEPERDMVTIMHPEQDKCLIVQHSAEKGVIWDTEFITCMEITERFRRVLDYQSLLVCYNGGNTTKKEIMATLACDWPILLIADSGGNTDKLAHDPEFTAHGNVFVTEKSVESIRSCLCDLNIMTRPAHIISNIHNQLRSKCTSTDKLTRGKELADEHT